MDIIIIRHKKYNLYSILLTLLYYIRHTVKHTERACNLYTIIIIIKIHAQRLWWSWAQGFAVGIHIILCFFFLTSLLLTVMAATQKIMYYANSYNTSISDPRLSKEFKI